MKKSRIGEAFPMGASVVGRKTVQFVTKINQKKEISLILYEKRTGEKEEYKFTDEYRIGNMYSMVLEDIHPGDYTYNFLENGKVILDPYAKVVCGKEIWGEYKREAVSAGIPVEKFSWEEDRPLLIPYEDSVVYQLHVRGFTRHTSSGVRKKGTFEGITEKIPYLKELGITAVELLPAYEFTECEKEGKLNYWGFKEACYFAPKASYSGGKNPVNSFKQLVKELHRAGLEIVMQFYFPETITGSYLLEVVKYWVREYHIDGVHLLGCGLPVSVIATQPELWNVKIWYEQIPVNEIYEYSYVPAYKNLAVYNEGYLYAVRKFLKGDVGSLQKAFEAITVQTKKIGSMAYITNYNTFTLKDMVSYERKHNEENGENGRDGRNYNQSWNCGVEGKTKKKSVLALRDRQMRNAAALLFLSRGTPVLLAGDEFGNSQGGNNNPYCQDNSVSWLDWKDLKKNREQYEFIKCMIDFRKKASFLKKDKEQTGKDAGEAYPYISFHGTEAWKLDWSAANEEAGGILYYEDYSYYYIGFNMHWQENTLVLPNIPGNHTWELLLDTSMEQQEKWSGVKETTVVLSPRTIKIMRAKGNKDDFKEGLSTF